MSDVYKFTPDEILSPDEEVIHEQNKKIERLQEQLADANKTIDYYDKKDFHYTLVDGTVMGKEPAHQYKLKWGVK